MKNGKLILYICANYEHCTHKCYHKEPHRGIHATSVCIHANRLMFDHNGELYECNFTQCIKHKEYVIIYKEQN